MDSRGANGSDAAGTSGPAAAAPQRDTMLEQTYPLRLEQAERKLIELRRNHQDQGQGRGSSRSQSVAPDDRVGVAFSGGGIRSATFCLGVLQSFARNGLLGRFDYLSTVSGGGYAGSFLTRLFSRDYIRNVGDVAARLRSDHPPPSHDQPDPVEFLRENSRYLAPKAGGDLLLDVVVVLRNWVALQVVLATFFLMLLVGLQTLRILVELRVPPLLRDLGPLRPLGHLALQPQHWLDGISGGLVQWSPWIDLLLPWLLCAVLPFGWVYWLIGYLSGPEQPVTTGPKRHGTLGAMQAMGNAVRWTFGNLWRAEIHPLWGFFAVIGTCLYLRYSGDAGTMASNPATLGATVLLLVCAITGALYLCFLVRFAAVDENSGIVRRLAQAVCDFVMALLPFNPVRNNRRIQRDAHARNTASSLLATVFAVWLALLLLCLIDSFGQTLYVRLMDSSTSAPLTIGAVFAAVVALATRASNITGFLSRITSKLGAGASFNVLSSLAAWLLIVVILSGADGVSHAIAWRFQPPAAAPATVATMADAVAAPAPAPGTDAKNTAQHLPASSGSPAPNPAGHARHFRHALKQDLLFCGEVLLGLFAFSILFGRAWPFLNRSSQHPLYRDRLARAYLGASNQRRAEPGKSSITDPIPGDDGLCSECWSDQMFKKGAPLHLLNVTANETASTHGKTVFRDRKGIGLAAGPCGLSAGARHHALFDRDDRDGSMNDGAYQPLLYRPGAYSMFGSDGGAKKPERLTLGQWMAISGAAFSTGMGYHTTFALSVLTGFANLRLGYWWDSGAIPPFYNRDRTFNRMLGHHVFHFLFPVQAYLLNELTASFHGPDEPHWYLSDGGSFENMGGYELIRRRLPVMVIVDGEEDPDYSYEGLANLVRKARMDFGAEIRFLDKQQLAPLNMPAAIADCFDHPDRLRPDSEGYSTAHAALASVRYGGSDTASSVLIYIKPTLQRDVPADVREYQVKNKPFPQQPTMNQFFDEAQWESYRRLGEYIADKVFIDAARVSGSINPTWSPAQLTMPAAALLG